MKTRNLLIAFIVLLCLPLKAFLQPINQQDSLTLIDMYHTLSGNPDAGPSWPRQSNWLTTKPVSTWYGITVTGDRVTGINLSGDWLRGDLPNSMPNLTELTSLNLSNGMYDYFGIGNIAALKTMPKLKYLYLQYIFAGNVIKDLAGITTLTELDLTGNKLTSLPDSIGSLVNLTKLILANNQITGAITPAIGNLVDLKVLHLENNHLSGAIPAEMANIGWGGAVYLAGNQLTALPPSFGHIGLLDATSNNIAGTIPNILPADSLNTLLLPNNKLTGALPSSIGNLTRLDVTNNMLVNDISIFNGNTNIQYLYMAKNQFTGVLDALASCTALKEATLADNQFTGNLPLLAPTVEVFDASRNQLTGGLPSFTSNTALRELLLGNNQLSGNVNNCFTSLPHLRDLLLDSNAFTGTIPTTLTNLPNLWVLDMSSNQLTGSIPSTIGSMPNLQRLLLGHNQLSGAIPKTMGSAPLLFDIFLQYNQLTGGIPKEFGQLNIASLDLSHNQLTGGIPTQVQSRLVYYIDLSYNQLTGQILPVFGKSVRTAILNNNHFSGDITNLFANTPSIGYLDISNNEFTGGIPVRFRYGSIGTLHFQNNKLSGKLYLPTMDYLYNGWFYGNSFDFSPTLASQDVLFNFQTKPIIKDGYRLSVSTGGTLANNKYEWYKDGLLMATKTGDSTYDVVVPGHYNVVVTDLVDKTKTEGVEIIHSDTVFSKAAAVVTIAITPDGTQCFYAGKEVDFKASAVNGGPSPKFEWQINGVLIRRSYDSTFKPTILKNDDVVRCILTSNADSVAPAIDTSNYITMAIASPVKQVDTLMGCNSLVYKGVTYTNSILLRDTLHGWRGCDSVYKSTLIRIIKIKPVTNQSTVSGCKKVRYNNITYTASTTLRDTLHNINGCDSVYNVVNIVVLTKPAAPSAIIGPDNVSAGQIIQFSVTGVEGLQYYWVVNNGTILTDQGMNYISVQWGHANGTVSVYAINTCDTSAASNKKITRNSGGSGKNAGVSSDALTTTGKRVMLYPNPAKSAATLQLSGLKGKAFVTITNAAGKKLKQIDNVTSANYALPVAGLSAGLYFVTVTDDAGTTTIKLIKSN